jgi:hypothetical protein
MEDQLKKRYLKDNKCIHGLYLVGKFDCAQWDQKQKHSCKLSNGEMLKKLENQAQDLSEHNILIKSFVLNASLP